MPGTSFLSCKSKLEPLSPPAGSHHTLTAQAGRAIKAFQNLMSPATVQIIGVAAPRLLLPLQS